MPEVPKLNIFCQMNSKNIWLNNSSFPSLNSSNPSLHRCEFEFFRVQTPHLSQELNFFRSLSSSKLRHFGVLKISGLILPAPRGKVAERTLEQYSTAILEHTLAPPPLPKPEFRAAMQVGARKSPGFGWGPRSIAFSCLISG